MVKQKMNTVLAAVEHSVSVWKRNVEQYINYFRKDAGQFVGQKNTYTPREGYPDDPSKQGVRQVATTVSEQFEYMKNATMRPYLTQLFSVEATNSLGAKRVPLIVSGINFGELTALELMRLKSLLTDGKLDEMLQNIPVRSDSKVWNPTSNEEYKGREIFETPLISGVAKTTEREEVILKDPNLNPEHLPSNYVAKTTVKNKVVEIGDYTVQNFSGEWTQLRKAQLLQRKSALLAAVIAALKEVNDVEAAPANFEVDQFLDYLFK